MHYVGWDLGKRYSYLTVVDAKGSILQQQKLVTTTEALRDFFQTLGPETVVALEATRSWYAPYEVVEPLVHQVQLANPMKTRAIAEARVKTDKVDSKILAHLVRTDLLPNAYVASRPIRDLRELLRHRAFLVRLQTRVKNRIHVLVDKQGLSFSGTDLFGIAGLQWLKALELRSPYRANLDRYLSVLQTVQAQIAEVSREVDRQARLTPEAKLLQTVPGIGPYTALLILAEIGDISRFPSPKQLVSYAGLHPRVYQSGDVCRYGHLTKTGSAWLRWALIEAATHLQRTPGSLQEFFRRLQRKKGNKAARVATARKLLTILYWMLKHQTPYRGGGQPAIIAGWQS